MKAISLRQRILKFLQNNPTFWNGGELERLALENGYKASNCSRRCREMVEDGLIEREERKSRTGIKTVWYRFKQKEPMQLNLI